MLSHPLTYPQPPVASLTFVLPIAQLAEAVPVPGSGLTLPLDLHAIGARCTNAYYAPKRFAAVQLAFSNPRCRVLVFHTGRLVGTGARFGPHTPRLSAARAVLLLLPPLHRVRWSHGGAHGHTEGRKAAGGRGQGVRAHSEVLGNQPGARACGGGSGGGWGGEWLTRITRITISNL